jgi:hypothetical protein
MRAEEGWYFLIARRLWQFGQGVSRRTASVAARRDLTAATR